jgi:hypothetical protein
MATFVHFRVPSAHRRSLQARPLAALAPAAFACWLSGCGGSPAHDPANPPASSLPAYRGDVADQFDDTIEAHAVGLELENYSAPKNDVRLRARALAADTVVRARVQTVTGEAGSGAHSYQLSFRTITRLAGKHPLGDEFTVRVDKTSPSLGIVKSMEGQLVGKTLVVFAKAFARPDGDRDIHFHAAADGADVAAAVKEAVVLDEVK